MSRMEVLGRLHFKSYMKKRKLKYAGHALRGSSKLSHLQILESRIEGKRKQGAPRRVWIKDVCEWVDWNDKRIPKEKWEHME